MRSDGFDDQAVADAPLTLFGFLNGYLLATLSVGVEGPAAVPAIDPVAYPTMAQLVPLQADFGSHEEFDRMLDTVLSGISRRKVLGSDCEDASRRPGPVERTQA
jgi:hypothetical protein